MLVSRDMLRGQNLKWEEFPVEQNIQPKPGAIVPCCMCGNPFQVPQYIGTQIDPVCAECFKTYNETAKLECVRCHIVVGRIAPKTLDCGFEVRPSTTLHTNECSVCNPEIKQSTVMEVEHWIKHVRRPPIYTSTGGVYNPGARPLEVPK